MDELADKVYDEMYATLGAYDPTARLLAGLAMLATLRVFGCSCKLDPFDPRAHRLYGPQQWGCVIHGD